MSKYLSWSVSGSGERKKKVGGIGSIFKRVLIFFQDGDSNV